LGDVDSTSLTFTADGYLRTGDLEWSSWCAYSRRWQERLDGVDAARARQAKPTGFVAARVASTGAPPTVRIEDVFERLPTLKNRDLESLLPHNWRPADKAAAPVAQAASAAVNATTEPSAAG